MSDNNQDGMRNFENDQPDVFQMGDTSDELLPYEGFMSTDYASTIEEKTEQTNSEEQTQDKINFEEDLTDPTKTQGTIADGNSTEIDFEDKDAPVKTDEFKAEEAIKNLEALGFKVEKDGTVDPLQAKEFEIKQLDRVNNDLKEFLQSDDLSLCEQHVVDEIINEWKKTGRTPDLKSEEFKLEVKFQMAQFEDNPRLASLQANQVKQILNGAIQRNEAKKTEISTEVKNTRDKEIQENRQALQSAFTNYNGKTLFGQKIDAELLKTAYRNITSGEFTKQIESDRSLQAEFSLYLQLRKNIDNNGNGTYNEGVAAAVKALEGNGPKVESSLAQTVSRNGAGAVMDRLSAWRAAEKVEDTKK